MLMIDASDVVREAAVVEGFHGRFLGELSADELAAFVAAGVAARRRLDVLIALGAVEVEERDEKAGPSGGFSRRRGQPTARRKIAEELGGSEGEAEKLLQVGRLLKGADDAGGEDGGDDSPHPDDGDGPNPDADSGSGSDANSDKANPDSANPGPDGDGGGEDVPSVWPLVAAAVREGRISTDKAEVLKRALEAIGERALPGLEAELVDKAAHLSLRDLKRAVDAVIAEMDRKALKRRQEAQHGQRHVRIWQGRDGMTKISGSLDPETATPLTAFVQNYVRAQYVARRNAQQRGDTDMDERSTVQMNADALATMATHLLACGQAPTRSATTVVVRGDRRELEDELGIATLDQTHAPVSGEVLRRMACAAGRMPVLTDGRSLPQDYGTTVEFFTLEQRLAMLERDGGCAKCHVPPSWCEGHHLIARHMRGPTSVRNGVMLCTRCHHDVHRDGWDFQLRHTRGPDGTREDQIWIIPPATIDPTRTPRLGGRAALRINHVKRDPLPPPETDHRDDDEAAQAEHEDAARIEPEHEHQHSHTDRENDVDHPLPAGIPF